MFEDILKKTGAEYRRTLNHNYLVIRKSKEDDEDYELDMVMQNNIKGLLPIDIRMSEGNEYLYYEISSMQPLKRLYDHREFEWGSLKKICAELISIMSSCGEYMLDTEHLILDPSCIYMGMDDGRPALVFLPSFKDDAGKGFVSLAEFFMERVSHEDTRASRFAYSFYQTVRKDGFVISDIERIISDCDTDKDKDKDTGESRKEQDIRDITQTEPLIFDLMSDDDTEDDTAEDDTGKNDKTVSVKKKEKKAEGNRKLPLAVFFTVMLICAAVIMGVIPGTDTYTAKMSGKALFLCTLAAFIIRLFRDRKKGNCKTIEVKDMDDLDDCFSEFEKKDRKQPETLPVNKETLKEKTIERKTSPDDDMGKTVFWDLEDEPAVNVLVDKKGKEYSLEHFPFVIGKKADLADLVLNDKTVSRIHAELTEENGKVFIQDCNSTNGTFLNGIQLNGNERLALSREDEIEIGRVKLEYR